jgi:putative hydrolase of the HAD superfamily
VNSPRALVLDYGKVLSMPPAAGCFDLMASRVGSSREALHSAYFTHRLAYDSGLSPERYWTSVIETANGSPSRTLIDALIADDNNLWGEFREDLWALTAEFRSGGGRTAFLSNNIPPLMAHLRAKRPLEALFDVVIASCEVGLIKPDPAIYRHCLGALDIPAEEVLFVDDVRGNLVAAEALGIRVFHFDDKATVTQLRTALGM